MLSWTPYSVTVTEPSPPGSLSLPTCTTSLFSSSSMVAGPSLITLTDSWKLTLFRARSLGVVSLTSSAGRHDFCIDKQKKGHEARTCCTEGLHSVS